MGLAWLFLSSVWGEEEQTWRTMDHPPPQIEGSGRDVGGKPHRVISGDGDDRGSTCWQGEMTKLGSSLETVMKT